jgi:hypothetical protein
VYSAFSEALQTNNESLALSLSDLSLWPRIRNVMATNNPLVCPYLIMTVDDMDHSIQHSYFSCGGTSCDNNYADGSCWIWGNFLHEYRLADVDLRLVNGIWKVMDWGQYCVKYANFPTTCR